MNKTNTGLKFTGFVALIWVVIVYAISFICVTEVSQVLFAKQLPLIAHIIAAIFAPMMIPAGVIAWFIGLIHPGALFH